jgi:uncharacterized protein YndB with AHSA1/START domain
MTPDSLVVEFDVKAPPSRAFRLWTANTGLWWPKDHTVTGDPASVAFEPYVGGRIVERSESGQEHVWGRVTTWDEPERLEFSWHLFFDEALATQVSLTFEPVGTTTRIRLVNSGFASLPEEAAAQARRERTGNVWTQLTAQFASFADSAEVE